MSDKKRELENAKDEPRLRRDVIRLKEYGKKIEDIQKSRISPDIISIQDRIIMNTKSFMKISSQIISHSEIDYNIDRISLNNVLQPQINAYKSIRVDICEALKKKERTFKDRFDKMFPEILYSGKTIGDVKDSCFEFVEQLLHIHGYLDRYLKKGE